MKRTFGILKMCSVNLRLLSLLFFLVLLTAVCSRKGQKGCPQNCICQDKQAYCDATMLRSVPRHFPPDTEIMNMRDNVIRKLKRKHFRGLRNLKHLLMKGNQISYIEPLAFREMSHLISLSLTENRIRRLHSGTFVGLKHLRVFSMRNNRLKSMENLFHEVPNLQLLNLGNNRIRKITNNTFHSNTQLRIVDLHNNSIHHLDKNAFRRLPYLRFLVLRDNPLKTVSLNFRHNFHVELLDFTNCKLRSVVKGLPTSINDLRMSENNITRIEADDFNTTRRIRLLVLNNNQISKIDDRALRKLWMLYDLYIGKNRLRRLPCSLPRSLHGLYANYNNITKLEGGKFLKNDNLEFLFLKNNRIKRVSKKALKGLNILRSLDLSSNAISSLGPMVFEQTSRMELLDLSNNPIKQLVQKSFYGLENLHILQLSSLGNNSSVQPAVFKDIKKLLFLDLRNSSKVVKNLAEDAHMLNYLHSIQDLNMMDDELHALPSYFPLYFPDLRIIKLVGNPWHCDDSILWLTEWMKNTSVEFFARDYMRCASPPTMQGRRIAEIHRDDITPTVTSLTQSVTSLEPTVTSPTKTVSLFEIPFKYADIHTRPLPRTTPTTTTTTTTTTTVKPEVQTSTVATTITTRPRPVRTARPESTGPRYGFNEISVKPRKVPKAGIRVKFVLEDEHL